MKRVSVVGTRHEEKGRANSSELLAILERIKPEIIFLEWPPAAFDAYFNGDPGNLEAIAVTRYCEDHNVDLIPVDLPTPGGDFFFYNQGPPTKIYTLPPHSPLPI